MPASMWLAIAPQNTAADDHSPAGAQQATLVGQYSIVVDARCRANCSGNCYADCGCECDAQGDRNCYGHCTPTATVTTAATAPAVTPIVLAVALPLAEEDLASCTTSAGVLGRDSPGAYPQPALV